MQSGPPSRPHPSSSQRRDLGFRLEYCTNILHNRISIAPLVVIFICHLSALSIAYCTMSVRNLHASRALCRLVTIKRPPVFRSSSYFQSNSHGSSFSTAATVKPEDIIQESSNIRESIQGLNDVSVITMFYRSFY